MDMICHLTTYSCGTFKDQTRTVVSSLPLTIALLSKATARTLFTCPRNVRMSCSRKESNQTETFARHYPSVTATLSLLLRIYFGVCAFFSTYPALADVIQAHSVVE